MFFFFRFSFVITRRQVSELFHCVKKNVYKRKAVETKSLTSFHSNRHDAYIQQYNKEEEKSGLTRLESSRSCVESNDAFVFDVRENLDKNKRRLSCYSSSPIISFLVCV